jgi:uncharacterized protein HemX
MTTSPYADYSTEQLDPRPQRNNRQIATLGLIGTLLVLAIGVGFFFLGQSTRMSDSEVVAQERKLVATSVQQRANQDAARERQAVAKAVAKQKAHDQQIAKRAAAHAKSEGESSGRAQGESSGKAQGESSGRAQGEASGKTQAESETTKITGHDAEGYAYGYLPDGQACEDNPHTSAPACS